MGIIRAYAFMSTKDYISAVAAFRSLETKVKSSALHWGDVEAFADNYCSHFSTCHMLLLQRLYDHDSVGVTGVAHLWFSSYLHDRWQYVSVGEASSTSTPLHCGVPQESVLGPILFSLYTTLLGQLIDMHEIPRQHFADDSQLYTCVPTNAASAQCALQKLEH